MNVRIEWRMHPCAMCAEQCANEHVVHVCNALCMVCMCVHLCAPALQLPTLVSMRTARDIDFVCVWKLKAHVENPIRKMCLTFQTHIASNLYIVFEISKS